MQQNIARFLLFSAYQQQQDAGLSSQLHALRLQSALQAEKLQGPVASQQRLSDLGSECSRLLIAAGASQQAADARWDLTAGTAACAGSFSDTNAPCSSWCVFKGVAHGSQVYLHAFVCRAARCAAATAAAASAGCTPFQLQHGANLVRSLATTMAVFEKV